MLQLVKRRFEQQQFSGDLTLEVTGNNPQQAAMKGLTRSHDPMIATVSEAFKVFPDETPLEHIHTHTHTDHLGNTEAVFEVVERDVVVSSVDLKQELLQNLRLDVES